MIGNFWVIASLFAQGTNIPIAILPNGLMQQKVQNPVVINTTGINSLFALDALQTPNIPQMGPQSQLNAKRFWFRKFTNDKKLEWNISVPKAGYYYVTFLINSKPGNQIKITGPKNKLIFVSRFYEEIRHKNDTCPRKPHIVTEMYREFYKK